MANNSPICFLQSVKSFSTCDAGEGNCAPSIYFMASRLRFRSFLSPFPCLKAFYCFATLGLFFFKCGTQRTNNDHVVNVFLFWYLWVFFRCSLELQRNLCSAACMKSYASHLHFCFHHCNLEPKAEHKKVPKNQTTLFCYCGVVYNGRSSYCT